METTTTVPVPATINLEGKLQTWTLDPSGKRGRKFISVTIPFSEARQAFKPDPFKANNGQGEQREAVESHVRKLSAEMSNHSYTPTAVSVGIRKHHLPLVKDDNGYIRLLVSVSDPLPQTDGGHRFAALNQIYKNAEATNDEAMKALVDKLPIAALVLLDGDTKRDFINLQAGRSVDAAHMLSMKIRAKMLGANEQVPMELANKVALILNKSPDSPFEKLIRFDSKSAGVIGKLPITTLTAKGASDIATSLFGLAKVMGAAADAEKTALIVCMAVKAVQDQFPSLLLEKMPLSLPKENGTKGSATMLLGLGVCLAYRLKAAGRELPEEDDLNAVAKSAYHCFSDEVNGNFSGPVKRTAMGEFAVDFFKDSEEDKHCGIPVGLLRTLSCSTFGVGPIPRKTTEAAAG